MNSLWEDTKQKHRWARNPDANKPHYKRLGRIRPIWMDDLDVTQMEVHEGDRGSNSPSFQEYTIGYVSDLASWGYKRGGNTKCYKADLPSIESIIDDLDGYCIEAKILVQPPGECVPWHRDSFDAYRMRHNVTVEPVQRLFVFLSDWDWAQCFMVGPNAITNWSAGDTITWTEDMYHASFNAGMSNKYTLSITGIPLTENYGLPIT